MRITIVKNDDFKTIGLHVETTNPGYFTPERVFSLGIHPSSFNYSKTVDGDYYEKEVFALVKADKELEAARNLMDSVAKAITVNGLVATEQDGSFSVGDRNYYTNIIDAANKKVMRLCEALEEAIANRNKK